MSCRFSRWRISAILDFRGPIMGSSNNLCTTSYRSSIDTIAVDCLVFEKIPFLHFGVKIQDSGSPPSCFKGSNKIGSLKSPCTTSYKSLIETIPLNCHPRWRRSAILDLDAKMQNAVFSKTKQFRAMVSIDDLQEVVHKLFKEPIIEPLKSKIAVAVFEQIAFFAFWRQIDKQTDRQTDKRMDSIDAQSRSRCCERRLNKAYQGRLLRYPASKQIWPIHRAPGARTGLWRLWIFAARPIPSCGVRLSVMFVCSVETNRHIFRNIHHRVATRSTPFQFSTLNVTAIFRPGSPNWQGCAEQRFLYEFGSVRFK